jgi:hypothetical protein
MQVTEERGTNKNAIQKQPEVIIMTAEAKVAPFGGKQQKDIMQ